MNEKLEEQILHTQKRQQILQPWTYITEKATYITLSLPVRIDYAENPKIVLQKIEKLTGRSFDSSSDRISLSQLFSFSVLLVFLQYIFLSTIL